MYGYVLYTRVGWLPNTARVWHEIIHTDSTSDTEGMSIPSGSCVVQYVTVWLATCEGSMANLSKCLHQWHDARLWCQARSKVNRMCHAPHTDHVTHPAINRLPVSAGAQARPHTQIKLAITLKWKTTHTKPTQPDAHACRLVCHTHCNIYAYNLCTCQDLKHQQSLLCPIRGQSEPSGG